MFYSGILCGSSADQESEHAGCCVVVYRLISDEAAVKADGIRFPAVEAFGALFN